MPHTRYAASSGSSVTGAAIAAAIGASTNGRLPTWSGAMTWLCSWVCRLASYI
jgi:hypothetical protein